MAFSQSQACTGGRPVSPRLAACFSPLLGPHLGQRGPTGDEEEEEEEEAPAKKRNKRVGPEISIHNQENLAECVPVAGRQTGKLAEVTTETLAASGAELARRWAASVAPETPETASSCI